MSIVNVYLVELGVFLPRKTTEESEYEAFLSYDGRHSFYDESQEYRELQDKDAIIREVLDYVKKGVPNTYGVVSSADFDEEIIEKARSEKEFGVTSIPVEGEDYRPMNVVWSVYKDEDGELHFNFIEKQMISKDFPDSPDLDVEEEKDR